VKKYCFVFLLLVFFLLSKLVFAQDGLPRFRHFGLEQGLSTSSVTSICQDKEGKIWVGTHDGLNCAYGTFFKTFYQNRDDSTGLNQSAISDLICDQTGILWIATYGGGINCMDPVSQRFISIPDALKRVPWTQANCIAEDKKGKIYIGFYEGLAIYDPVSGEITTIDKIPGTQKSFSILRIAFDEQDVAFLASPFDGMFALENQKVLVSVPFSDFQREPNGIGFFHHLYTQPKGILACSQSGPLRFWYENKSIRWEKASDLPDQEILAYLRDSKGRRWLPLTRSGFRILNAKGAEIFMDFPYKGHYPGGRINDIFQDRWGGIWLGSAEGLSYTHPQLSKFSSWSFDASSKNEGLKIVWSIFTEDDQNFVLGSESGLYSFNASLFTSKRIPFSDGKREKVVYSLLKTQSNRLLAGTSQGVFEILGEGNQKVAERVFGHIDGVISCLKELPNGDLLVGTYDDRGMYRLDRMGNEIVHFTWNKRAPGNLVNNSLNCMQMSMEGKVWIGTDNGFSLFDPSKNLFDSSIWDLWPVGKKYSSLIYGIVDYEDQLWIGTFGSGIAVFDKQKRTFRYLGIEDGLPNESIYQLASKGDEIWASTNKGLCLINRKTFNIRIFTEGDGLQSNEFNHFASFQNPKTGRIYFGGLSGFDEVSKFSKPENVNLPRVVLSSARLITTDRQVDLPITGTGWKLDYQEQNLEIEFAAVNYLMPEKNQFAYILSGSTVREKNRIPLGEKNKITLVNLEPGEYSLQIFAANNEGLWSIKPFEIPFSIKPPIWKTGWFRFLVVLLVLVSAFLIFRLYLKAKLKDQTLTFERKEAVRHERNRISTEMHDDLGSGLTSIKMLSELLRLRTGKEPVPELQKIANRSDELVESLNTIVWALNDRNDQMEPMVAYFRAFASSQFEERQMDLTLNIDVSSKATEIEIQGEVRRNIFLILKESIHNVFKHSGADSAEIRIHANESGFDLWISDNGKGMDPGIETIGNGLKNMKARALNLGGTIEFESENGFQTHFHLPLYNERVIG